MPEKMFFEPTQVRKSRGHDSLKKMRPRAKKQRMRAKEKKEIWQKHKKGFFYVLQT